MISFETSKKQIIADPETKTEYGALQEEFAIAAAMIAARASANLTRYRPRSWCNFPV